LLIALKPTQIGDKFVASGTHLKFKSESEALGRNWGPVPRFGHGVGSKCAW